MRSYCWAGPGVISMYTYCMYSVSFCFTYCICVLHSLQCYISRQRCEWSHLWATCCMIYLFLYCSILWVMLLAQHSLVGKTCTIKNLIDKKCIYYISTTVLTSQTLSWAAVLFPGWPHEVDPILSPHQWDGSLEGPSPDQHARHSVRRWESNA